MNPIGKLLPKDGFIVTMNESPSIDYSKSLTHLYQPLLGTQAISLYETLLNESLTKDNQIQTHHTLMNYLQLSLPDIYRLRLKLEGIGLLKTFKYESIEETIYTYEIQKPFSPEQFFKETMLSELLLHHIGESRFNELKSRFSPHKQRKGKEITASFHTVFETISLNNGKVHISQNTEEERKLVETLDFSWLEIILNQRMLPVRKILTGRNKQILSELKHLYNLTTNDIEKALLWSITEEHTLNIDLLKEECHNIYASKGTGMQIRLQVKQEKTVNEQDISKLSKEEQLIYRFETMTPRQLLEDLSGGQQASERDLKIIRDVMISQNIPEPVMNVLVHYVLIQSNMKLSKAYLETIASHWSRANLQTAKEAMEFAKNEINEMKNRKNKRKQRKSTEIIPDWFNERKKAKIEETDEETPISEQEELMKRLQRHANKNNH